MALGRGKMGKILEKEGMEGTSPPSTIPEPFPPHSGPAAVAPHGRHSTKCGAAAPALKTTLPQTKYGKNPK